MPVLSFRTAGLAASAIVVAATLAVPGHSVRAQSQYKTLGPPQCLNCHEHQKESDWHQTREREAVARKFPERGLQAGHINSMDQLVGPKADAYAKAINLGSPFDAKGACVKCHATVFGGEANAGVSCESCHGAAGGYITLHQTKGAYKQALGAGMVDLKGRPEIWIPQCLGCHVMKDAKLIAAGHRSGSDFNLSTKFEPVSLHFRGSAYTADQISSAVTRLTKPEAPAPPVPAPVPQPVPPPAPTPVTTTQPATPPVATPERTTTTTVIQPTAPIPRPSDLEAPRKADPPKSPTTQPTTALGTTPQPASTPAPASTPGTFEPAPPPRVDPGGTTVSLASVQGRVIAALTRLLNEGRAAPVRQAPPARIVPPSGPDAALLELQSEVIALGLQVLGKSPPKTPPVKKFP